MVDALTVAIVFQAIFAGVVALFAWANWRQTEVIAGANDSMAGIQEQVFQLQMSAFALAAAEAVKRQALDAGKPEFALDIDERMSALILLDFTDVEALEEQYEEALGDLVRSYVTAAQQLYRQAQAERFAAGTQALDAASEPPPSGA